VILDEVDSTLDEAARRAPELTAPCWILAHVQTAARGRRGRSWAMPRGNFAATMVLPDPAPARHAALRSFVMALALYDTCVAVTGRHDAFTLKWPNDVLLNGGKLAGILLENPGGRLSIGVGVNLVEAPGGDEVEAGALRPVALASETGALVLPEEFLDTLAVTYAGWEARFVAEGFAPIRDAWLSQAARLGETLTAKLPREEITGVFETLDSDGQLILRTPQGQRAIAAGDIFFG